MIQHSEDFTRANYPEEQYHPRWTEKRWAAVRWSNRDETGKGKDLEIFAGQLSRKPKFD